MSKRTKEQAPPERKQETRAERELRLLREAVRRGEERYREYLETLSPRDRERLRAS